MPGRRRRALHAERIPTTVVRLQREAGSQKAFAELHCPVGPQSALREKSAPLLDRARSALTMLRERSKEATSFSSAGWLAEMRLLLRPGGRGPLKRCHVEIPLLETLAAL